MWCLEVGGWERPTRSIRAVLSQETVSPWGQFLESWELEGWKLGVGVWELTTPIQSVRNATIGSTRIARRAGM
jgi:hypothetical protein